jgi:HEAT repeat protein
MDTTTREFMSRKKGLRNDTRAVEPLIRALNDPDKTVRAGAAFALGKIGDVRAFEPLLPLLKDTEILNDPEIESIPLYAISRMNDYRVVNILIQRFDEISDSEKEWRVRSTIILGLKNITDPRALEVFFLTATTHKDDEIKHIALDGLGRNLSQCSPDECTRTINDLPKDILLRALGMGALPDIPNQTIFERLLPLLEDSSPCIRVLCCYRLGEMRYTAAVPALVKKLEDTKKCTNFDVRVCDGATYALQQIGTPEALAALKKWQRQQGKQS